MAAAGDASRPHASHRPSSAAVGLHGQCRCFLHLFDALILISSIPTVHSNRTGLGARAEIVIDPSRFCHTKKNDTRGRALFGSGKPDVSNMNPSSSLSSAHLRRADSHPTPPATNTKQERFIARRLTSTMCDQCDDDAAVLARLGYTQTLTRHLNLFRNFAVCFSFVSPITGLTGALSYVWSYGGPVTVVWGWCLVAAANVVVGLALAEIASAFPTAGGVYFWAGRMGGRRYG